MRGGALTRAVENLSIISLSNLSQISLYDGKEMALSLKEKAEKRKAKNKARAAEAGEGRHEGVAAKAHNCIYHF